MAVQARRNRFLMALWRVGQQFSSWRPEEFRFRALLSVALSLPFLLLYWPLVQSDPLLDRDDIFLIGPLRDIHGAGDYLGRIRSGAIFDILPLRDLSYQVNLLFSGVPLLGNFHFTNCAIWALSAWLLFRILGGLRFSSLTILAVITLFVVHPVFVDSVAWVAARKHLLAAAFTLWATDRAVNSREGLAEGRGLQIGLLYSLAVLSHPIVVLWPVWWVLYLRVDRRRAWREIVGRALPLVPVMAAALALNWWYYSGPYLRATHGAPKFLPGDFLSLARFSFGSFGRHFFQLAVPLRVSPMDYDDASPLNLVGLFLLAALGGWSLLRNGWRTTLTWLAPFFLVMAVLLVRPTQVFVSDTYLLWPGVSLLVLFAYSIEGARQKISLGILTLVASGGLLLWYSLPLARAWRSMDQVMAYAYDTEPTSRVKHTYSLQLLGQGRCEEALAVALENVGLVPRGRDALAEIVLKCPTLPLAKREELLKRFYIPGLYYSYRLGAVLGMEGKYAEAFGLLRHFIPELGKADPEESSGAGKPGVVAAETVFFCEGSCAQANACRQAEREIRQRLAADPTEVAEFDRRLAFLRKLPKRCRQSGDGAS